jgi:hypothetical protein
VEHSVSGSKLIQQTLCQPSPKSEETFQDIDLKRKLFTANHRGAFRRNFQPVTPVGFAQTDNAILSDRHRHLENVGQTARAQSGAD